MKPIARSVARGIFLPFAALILFSVYQRTGANGAIDSYYTNGISKAILLVLSALTSWLPFSLAEFFVLGIVLLFIMFFVSGIRSVMKGTDRIRALTRITDLIALLVIGFLLIWGFNYRALGLSAAVGISPVQGDAVQLKRLGLDLVEQAKTERALTGLKDTEVFHYTGDLHQASLAAYETMAEDYPAFLQPKGRVKPLATSRWFSQMGISGIFFPYTGEANYNKDQPMLLIPSTILHELAHLKGIAREEEANFMAYFASRSSDDMALRYSSTMLALINTMNRLTAQDPDAAREVYERYSEGMLLDLADYDAYWDRFEGPIQEQAEAVNDQYLKSNGQETGVQSYEDMVSFLLDFWEKDNRN